MRHPAQASLLFWVTAISQSDALGSGAFIAERSRPDGAARRLEPPSRPDLAATTGSPCRSPSPACCCSPAAPTGACRSPCSGFWRRPPPWGQLAVHRHFAQSIPPTWLTCIQLAVTGLLGTLLSLLTEQWPASIGTGIWGWFAASVLIATTLRYWLLTHALSRMTTAHAALLMLLEPVWTPIQAPSSMTNRWAPPSWPAPAWCWALWCSTSSPAAQPKAEVTALACAGGDGSRRRGMHGRPFA